MIAVSASVLAADLGSLCSEVATVNTADRIHVDIMDGHFVPNISLGFPVAERIATCTELPIDIHLMVSNPQQHFTRLTELDVRTITVHAEVADDVAAVCQQLRTEGVVPGIAINPDTELETVESIATAADRLTLMGVDPGFSGQSFIPDTVERIETANRLFPHRIEVDGGVNRRVSQACIEAGADILVSGSAIFQSPDREASIRQLRTTSE
jgi:ribulose-phosphate 3-epimerase